MMQRWLSVMGEAKGWRLLSTLALSLVVALLTSEAAYAIDIGGLTGVMQVGVAPGIVSAVAKIVEVIVGQGWQKLYNGITKNSEFIASVNAVLVLYVAIYGILFMFGIVNATMGDATVRVIKVGVILGIVNGGPEFFSYYVGDFFSKGQDDLIRMFVQASTPGMVCINPLKLPLGFLDCAVSRVFSPQMLQLMLAVLANGLKGFTLFGVLAIGVYYFLQALFKALWTYLLSKIALMLLFGLAPLFFIFMLFERTKHLFNGWIGQMISYMLQPVLMFSFLGFFIMLVDSSMQEILKVDIRWAPRYPVDGVPISVYMWTLFNKDGTPFIDSFTNSFPIDAVNMLVFVLISYVAYQFTDQASSIAKEIAGAAAGLPSFGGSIFSETGANIRNAITGFGGRSRYSGPASYS